MSNISKSLGKSNGKKWSNIWTFLFRSGLKSPRKKKVFFLLILPWSTLLWHRCYYPHRSRDALSPVCGIFSSPNQVQRWRLNISGSVEHVGESLFLLMTISSLKLYYHVDQYGNPDMSNIFRVLESLGENNGKKCSNIWIFLFGSGLKSPRKKSFFLLLILLWSTILWHRCYYPHRSRDALSPVCGIFFFLAKKTTKKQQKNSRYLAFLTSVSAAIH